MNPNQFSGTHEPILVASVPFAPLPGTPVRWEAACPVELNGEYTVQIEYDAKGFPFERYCRFVRRPDESKPRTFDTLEFAESPPGIRVGPWPGWRSIPEFPLLTLAAGETHTTLRPNLYGDEFASGTLRAFCTLLCNGSRTLTATVESPDLVPLRADIYRTARIHATPQPLRTAPSGGSAHPRLLITPPDLTELRVRRTGSHADFWKRLESSLETWGLPFAVTPSAKAIPGPQRLAGEDRLMLSALVALVDPAGQNVSRALTAFHEYCAEASRPDFPPLGIDTQAGETLFQLCIGYDWLWGVMQESERLNAAKTITHVARVCRRHLDPTRRDYGQAHYLGCGLGLFAFTLLFREEYSEARSWGEELRGALDCALQLLPDGGAYPHGINLWIYEFSFLLRWMEILRSATGEDLWDSVPALQNIPAFRAAALSPDASRAITFGDPQFRTGGDSWMHFLLARRTRSGIAQWVGNALLDSSHEGTDHRNIPPRRRAYEFLYFDPAVIPRKPDTGHTFFSDTGQVFHRSENRLFTFRAGPPLGSRRYRMGEYGGYGHSDPSNGSFLLHDAGSFVVSGPGPVYRRDTSLHNVVTIDGAGQTGDSCVWLPDFLPPDRLPTVPSVKRYGDRCAISWNGTSAYLPTLGLQRLTRALFVDLEKYVIGYDIVICDRERRIGWNLHSWGEFHRGDRGGAVSYSLAGDTRLVLLAPVPREDPALEEETGATDFVPAYPNDGTQDYRLTLSLRSSSARFVWALLFGAQSTPRLEAAGRGQQRIVCGDGTILDVSDSGLTPEGSDALKS